MTDIVEELRSAPERLSNIGPNAEAMILRAAAEIERLRDALKPFVDAWECAGPRADLPSRAYLAGMEITPHHWQRAKIALTGAPLNISMFKIAFVADITPNVIEFYHPDGRVTRIQI